MCPSSLLLCVSLICTTTTMRVLDLYYYVSLLFTTPRARTLCYCTCSYYLPYRQEFVSYEQLHAFDLLLMRPYALLLHVSLLPTAILAEFVSYEQLRIFYMATLASAASGQLSGLGTTFLKKVTSAPFTITTCVLILLFTTICVLITFYYYTH